VEAHPDFAAARPPKRTLVGGLAMAPLCRADLEEDFAAVIRSSDLLRGLFAGDWPDGLIPEDDLLDLAWHEREFTLGRSFAWTLRLPDGAHAGCAYLFPRPGARGVGEAVFWLAADMATTERVAAFRAGFAAFLAGLGLPPERYPLRDPHPCAAPADP
jgi:hypothetical protein